MQRYKDSRKRYFHENDRNQDYGSFNIIKKGTK